MALKFETKEPRLAEIIRRRIRMQAAAKGFTHKLIAARMTAIGRQLLLEKDYSVSEAKVSRAMNGQIQIQVDEIEVWANALETSIGFLLGFTWDPTPDALVASSADGITLE